MAYSLKRSNHGQTNLKKRHNHDVGATRPCKMGREQAACSLVTCRVWHVAGLLQGRQADRLAGSWKEISWHQGLRVPPHAGTRG